MFVENLKRIVSKPNVTLGQILYCTTDSIPFDLMFQENFFTNTQVWNPMTHRNDCRQRGVIMRYLSVLQQQPVLGQEHQSSGGQVFHHMHGLGQQPTDRNRRQLRSQTQQLHDGSWWQNPTTPDDGHSNHPQTGKRHEYPQPALLSLHCSACTAQPALLSLH